MIVLIEKVLDEDSNVVGRVTYGNEDYCEFEIDTSKGILYLKVRGIMGARPRSLDNYNEIIVDGRTVYKQGEN